MSRSRIFALLLLTVVLGTAACDRTPVDPQDPNGELAALLTEGVAGGLRAPLSLQGLLHSAVDRVYREQGAGAARALIMELRQLHLDVQQAAAAGERESVTTHMRALHAAELDIVMSVFGDPLASRVRQTVSDDAVRLRARLAATTAAGHVVPDAAEGLAQVDELLVDAAAALEAGDARAALDAGSRAAALAELVRRALADAVRLPGVEQMFEQAVARLNGTAGAEQVRRELAAYHRLEEAARVATRTADRQTAHNALEAVRLAQIDIVLDVFGPAAAHRALQQARATADELATALASARAAGRDVSRLQRMMGSARDMLQRADAAFTRGEPAAALDLGTHAAGLLNAIQAAL